MKLMKTSLATFAVAVVLGLAGCASTPKSPDVADTIRKSLHTAQLKDVSVSQDREKGVVTLKGNVAAESQKSQAEAIAKSIATGQVVANEIAVRPTGMESEAKKIDSDLDKGIAANLDAALVQRQLKKGVKWDVNNAVVTLSGEVSSQADRSEVQAIASTVPNVRQVVNTLQVKGQKASSTM